MKRNRVFAKNSVSVTLSPNMSLLNLAPMKRGLKDCLFSETERQASPIDAMKSGRYKIRTHQ